MTADQPDPDPLAVECAIECDRQPRALWKRIIADALRRAMQDQQAEIDRLRKDLEIALIWKERFQAIGGTQHELLHAMDTRLKAQADLLRRIVEEAMAVEYGYHTVASGLINEARQLQQDN